MTCHRITPDTDTLCSRLNSFLKTRFGYKASVPTPPPLGLLSTLVDRSPIYIFVPLKQEMISGEAKPLC